MGIGVNGPSSTRGEVASQSIMSLLATGRRIPRRVRRFGRLSGTEGVVSSAPAEYMTLPHIIAVAEEFSRTSLMLTAQHRLGQRDKFHLALLEQGEVQAEGSWEGMRDAWAAWFGISLGASPDYSKLDAYIAVRNSIVHGLGFLTRKQKRRDGGRKLKAKLTNVGVGLVGDQIVLPFSAVEDCAVVARSYVLWLDREITRLPIGP